MSNNLKCPNCGSLEIDYDPTRGDSACIECGTVLEHNLIVNEVGFSEDARGRSNMVGQHVRADGQPTSFGAMPGYSRAATAVTMMNGRRCLGQLVSALKLSSRHTESALRLFRLAVERNFHKGRRMTNVCCACLYVVCRTERSPHMLIDFADVLETNVFVLGHTFLKFAQVLSVQLPIIDPSLYIHRFASKLEFGEKTHIVAMSALRIVARMQRDWLSHGRRPSSLCGAALLCAASMHDFHRSMIDVCRVVRVGNVSLRERLQELNRTPTAALTTAEIDAGGGDDGKECSLITHEGAAKPCDPPAFQRLKKKMLNAKMMEKDDQDAIGERSSKKVRIMPRTEGRTAEDEELERELEAALNTVELLELEVEACEEEKMETIARAFGKEKIVKKNRKKKEEEEAEKRSARKTVKKPAKEPEKGAEGEAGNGVETEVMREDAIENPGEQEGGQERGKAGLQGEKDTCHEAYRGVDDLVGELPGEGVKDKANEQGNHADSDLSDVGDEDVEDNTLEQKDAADLSDLDDEDAAKYLNTEEEYEEKKVIWTEINKEYLERQERLAVMKRDRPEEYKRLRPWRSANVRKANDDRQSGGNGDGAKRRKGEKATSANVEVVKASKKLNYSVLMSLEGSGGMEGHGFDGKC